MRSDASISTVSSRKQLTAHGIPWTTFRSNSEIVLPNVKMGMLFARRSRRRESLRVSVCVWDRESDFAITGMMFVNVDK
jgi:hypothetical protein